MRKLYITNDIDVDMYLALSREFNKADNDNVTEILLVINSHGGDAYAALAIYDLIRCYTLSGVKFTTLGTGFVASAATLILAAGHKRQITENTWVMVHEDISGVGKNDRVSLAERRISHSRALETQWNTILAGMTKLTAQQWADINQPETYLTPQECLKYGLVDEVI